jgi:hypothetical protein
MKAKLRLILLVSVLSLIVGGVAAAASDISGSVTQSYNAPGSVQPGMIVARDSKDAGTVMPLTLKNMANMLGVVVPINDAAIVLTPQSVKTQQVLVTASGRHNVLVSNQNGVINNGDYVTISSLEGIGMKADASQTKIVGRAAGGFSGNSSVAGTVTLKGSLGHDTTVSIGRIAVDVQVEANPLHQNTNNIRGFLTRAANGVSNKPVSQVRVYLSTAVLLGTLFVAGNMLYGAVRNGIQAIGRNPLAQKQIIRGLVQVIGVALAAFAVGVLAVYLILNY